MYHSTIDDKDDNLFNAPIKNGDDSHFDYTFDDEDSVHHEGLVDDKEDLPHFQHKHKPWWSQPVTPRPHSKGLAVEPLYVLL